MSMPVTPPTSAKAVCPVFFRCHCCVASGSATVPIEKLLTLHATLTFVIFDAATVPLPFVTLQAWFVGLVKIVTLYPEPLAMGDAKVKLPLPEIPRFPPPLFCSTNPTPDRPVTVTPILKVLVTQATFTFMMLVAPTVPDPLVTAQV